MNNNPKHIGLKHIGPYLREINEYPARRGRLPKLIMDRVTLVQPGARCSPIIIFHVFDPRRPTKLLGCSGSFTRAEQMAAGKIALAME